MYLMCDNRREEGKKIFCFYLAYCRAYTDEPTAHIACTLCCDAIQEWLKD